MDIEQQLLLLDEDLHGLFSKDHKAAQVCLESRKQHLLLLDEESWRLKSWALWLKSGDKNTEFFQNFANSRRNFNTIWDIVDSTGRVLDDQSSLEKGAVDFFKEVYTSDSRDTLSDQLQVVRLYPCIFPEEAGAAIFAPVTLDEIRTVLNHFEKEKSPSLDGWTIEFFIHFFDLFGLELLRVVEDSRLKGLIPEKLNSNFITLISKKDKPGSFNDFRPISLRNLVYKLISKIILNRIKPFLDSGLSKEQFGFLSNRQILDAVGVAQECLHSIKQKKMKVAVLKLDLMKAFDRVDWTFLRLILLQAGLPFEVVNWIMGCVSSANFSVLINGHPSDFFKGDRGLRQGCPLSPLLFLLVIEGLSLILSLAKANNQFTGIKITPRLLISHLLFRDDVLIFGKGSLQDWGYLAIILKLFCNASGMKINAHKSSFFISSDLEPDLAFRHQVEQLFPFNCLCLQDGFQYLDFYLKPNCYKSMDWIWLVRRIERKINTWTFRYLSLGGRLILLSSVIQGIPVLWMSLAIVPKKVLVDIRKRMFHFLWAGKGSLFKYHLAPWQKLALPKTLGGWGLKNLSWFAEALGSKTLWRALFEDGLWSFTVRQKYLHFSLSFVWLRNPPSSFSGASVVWRGLLKSLPLLKKQLGWVVGRGIWAYVGIDPIMGLKEDYHLSLYLLRALQAKNIEVLAQVLSGNDSGASSRWLNSVDLGLIGRVASEWDGYILRLQTAGITVSKEPDCLVWDWKDSNEDISAQRAYDFLVQDRVSRSNCWWFKYLWHWRIPLKLSCFMWLCLENRVLTWDNLQKRSFIDPDCYILYARQEETVSHLFVGFAFFLNVWICCQRSLHFQTHWVGGYFVDSLHHWFLAHPVFPELPLFIFWEIWKQQNGAIFEGRRASVSQAAFRAVAFVRSYCLWKTSST